MPMGRTTPTEPYLIQDSKFVRSARRQDFGQIQLTQIALGFRRGTPLTVLARQTYTTRQMLRWLQRLPWQDALVVPNGVSDLPARCCISDPLTDEDHQAIRELRGLKVSAVDIAHYLRLPLTLVTRSLRQRDDQERTPDEPLVDHASSLAG